MASGAATAIVAVYLFGAGVVAALLIYALVGAFVTVVAAWRRFRCIEKNEDKSEVIAAR